MARRLLVVLVFAAALMPASASAAPVTDGAARFEVVTPTLVRVQVAEDGRFEDGPTQTTAGRLPSKTRFTTTIRRGERIIRTSRLTLRWRRGATAVDGTTLRVKVGKQTLAPKPGPNPAPLGGWHRSLDLVDGPVPLHEGVLSRAGWYLLDDTATALMTGGGGFAPRAPHQGSYQDLYLFAYGSNLASALRDLRALT